MGAHDLVLAAARAHATSRAVHWIDRDRSLTYHEAAGAMERAAAVLSGLGVESGARVGLFAYPGLDYVVAMLGAWRIGAIPVPIDLAMKETLGEFLLASKPAVLVYTGDHFDHVDRARADQPAISRYVSMDGPQDGADGWNELMAEADASALVVNDGSDTQTAHISFPGNDPKRTTHRSHQELIEAAQATAERLRLTPADMTLCAAPLSGEFHLTASILPAFARGATAGLLKAWEPDAAWNAMEENHTTVLVGEPAHCAQLVEASRRRGRAPTGLRIGMCSPGGDLAEIHQAWEAELGAPLLGWQ